MRREIPLDDEARFLAFSRCANCNDLGCVAEVASGPVCEECIESVPESELKEAGLL